MKHAKDIDIEKIDTDSEEFQNALKLASYTSQSIFLTGKAGTGKSTFLKYLTATTKKKFVVLAPTGIAAVNAGGQTLHSFFKIPLKPLLPDDPDFSSARRIKERMKYKKETVKLLREIELIIIDEVSMVRADIIDFIDKILRTYCGNSRMPFAGKQLLLVGDVFQLEPVVTGDMRDVLSYYYKGGLYFFNARAFSDISVVPIELKKVYRQTDTQFLDLLDRIRVGRPSQSDIFMLNSRLELPQVSNSEDFTMTIATRRSIVDSINESHLEAIGKPERKFVGTITGDFPDSSLPTDKVLVVKEDAQVVFVKNDIDKRWVNGTIGRICEIAEDKIIIRLENGDKHTVEPELWDNVKYEYDEEKKKVNEIVIGTFKQFPIKLAWAITIHKSQGLTFDKVCVDIGQGAFSGGQTYVALSRCRSFGGLKLRSTINERDAFVNSRVLEFSRHFNDTSLINGALDRARADDCYHRAAKSFDAGDYREAASRFAEAVCNRNELGQESSVRLLSMKLSRMSALQARVDALEQKVAEDNKKFEKLAAEYVEMGEEVRSEGWDIEASLRNYDKAIWLCPEYYYAYLCKGMALAQSGEYDDAMAVFAKAAALPDADHRATYQAGRLAVATGDLMQGMDLLLQSLEINDKSADTHLALAEGYEKAGDEEQAEYHRRQAKKLSKV